MKKLLLMLSAAAFSTAAVNAQTRLALYEEFSGENCAPCASANPGLNTLLGANTSKVLLIKYQSPIPSAGPIYNAYKTITDARLSYYAVPFAPYGRLDGTGLGTGTAAPTSPGHVANLTQADINTDAAIASPFNITITHAWNATGDSVTANVNITAVSAFAPSGANLKLRIAIIEHLVYTKAPGTNGEKDFHNVVREMVPNATGTQLPNSWTASQTQSYTIKGKVASIVDKSNPEVVLVAWIQNDADKSIPQAAKSSYVAIGADVGTTGVTPASSIACTSTNASVTSTVTIKSTGTSNLTSAKVYCRADNLSTYATANWSGSLAPGATATVSVPAVSLSVGTRYIVDSVSLPNGSADINQGNNLQAALVNVVNPAGVAMPITQNFEIAGLPAGWLALDPTSAGNVWVNGNGTGLAHNASNYMPWYKIGTYAAGSVGYLIMPAPVAGTNRSLEFYQAYAQKTTSNNDKLEVVYSTNCGTSWTSLWSQSGSGLATTAATTTYWLPSPATGSTDWKLRTVSLNTLPANALLAFRATADGGNNLFIDDVNIKGTPAGVENVIANGQVSVYPNPAKDGATLEFLLNKSSVVAINVVDAVGRTVVVLANGTMQQGIQHISIPTATLAAGAYNIAIQTEEGTVTQRLSVVK